MTANGKGYGVALAALWYNGLRFAMGIGRWLMTR